MYRLRYLLMFILLPLFFSCKTGKKERQPLFTNPLKLIDSIAFGKKLPLEKYNFYSFWPTHTLYKAKTVFCLLSQAGSIHLFDAETLSLADSILLPTYTGSAKMYLRNDSIFIYDKPFFYICKIDGKEFKIVNKVKAPIIDYKKYSIKPFDAFLASRDFPINIVFGYGLRSNEEHSHLDTGTNLIRFADSSAYKKAGYFPKDFFEKKHYYNGTLLDIDTAGNLVFGYEEHDSLFKMDAQNRIIASGAVESSGDGRPFNWKKEQDLAYVRRYTCEAELNKAIRVLKNNYTLVLKKLHEKDITKPEMYRYLIFDSNLKLKYADSLKQVINPNFIFNYKNGIVFLSLQTDKMYYYEIP